MLKLHIKNTFLVTTFTSFIFTAHAAAPQPIFTPEQEARIGEIAADYLVAHPDVLVTVSQKLQEQQKNRQQTTYALKVMQNQQALLQDPDTPAFGPDTAKVAVIQFFDYQCTFCSRMAPEMEKVMQASPEVKFVFKEWPIFAGRWENSRTAAERGLAVWKAKGAGAYMTYHNDVFRTGHNEGNLTTDDIDQASRKAGLVLPATGESAQVLEKNNELAQSLGLTGTPGVIVMPLTGATPDTITVIPGLVQAPVILDAIKKAQPKR